jgi:hypothetical protein
MNTGLLFSGGQHNLPDNSPGKSKIIDLKTDKNVQSILLTPSLEKVLTHIVENCNPGNCQLNIGGAVMANPVLIKIFSRSFKNETIRFLVVEIDFGK